MASTEYYYKLFAEALSYEVGDFEQLHIVTSNEEIIREKNKHLIPIYLRLRNQIANYKREPLTEEKQRHAFQVERISNSNNPAKKIQQLLSEE